MSVLLWFALAFLGMAGVLIFGIMLVFEGLSAAKYRADGAQSWALMKGECKRSTKGTLKLFLISLALMLAGLCLSAVCSTTSPPPAVPSGRKPDMSNPSNPSDFSRPPGDLANPDHKMPFLPAPARVETTTTFVDLFSILWGVSADTMPFATVDHHLTVLEVRAFRDSAPLATISFSPVPDSPAFSRCVVASRCTIPDYPGSADRANTVWLHWYTPKAAGAARQESGWLLAPLQSVARYLIRQDRSKILL